MGLLDMIVAEVDGLNLFGTHNEVVFRLTWQHTKYKIMKEDVTPRQNASEHVSPVISEDPAPAVAMLNIEPKPATTATSQVATPGIFNGRTNPSPTEGGNEATKTNKPTSSSPAKTTMATVPPMNYPSAPATSSEGSADVKLNESPLNGKESTPSPLAPEESRICDRNWPRTHITNLVK
ncbi:Aste57867_1803 [Aphanomyces stellatus]|uniref:Aste57867_1803 protein n=1 Tax=Aphanomyces stellatus TaxID=120398 RepID=A0A485K8P4_9STRA|nr:hypothetical protein As57867_001801 [Aphanomyces stellatus]VFT79012.1 Aste57867_1803 [Aphanomyces stellatus]